MSQTVAVAATECLQDRVERCFLTEHDIGEVEVNPCFHHLRRRDMARLPSLKCCPDLLNHLLTMCRTEPRRDVDPRLFRQRLINPQCPCLRVRDRQHLLLLTHECSDVRPERTFELVEVDFDAGELDLIAEDAGDFMTY